MSINLTSNLYILLCLHTINALICTLTLPDRRQPQSVIHCMNTLTGVLPLLSMAYVLFLAQHIDAYNHETYHPSSMWIHVNKNNQCTLHNSVNRTTFNAKNSAKLALIFRWYMNKNKRRSRDLLFTCIRLGGSAFVNGAILGRFCSIFHKERLRHRAKRKTFSVPLASWFIHDPIRCNLWC